MNLDPISISTGGYVCNLIPNDISVALDGYECATGIPPANPPNNIDGIPIVCTNIDGVLIVSSPI